MIKVEFDIEEYQLNALGWQEGDMIQDANTNWLISSIIHDSTYKTIWVTLQKVDG